MPPNNPPPNKPGRSGRSAGRMLAMPALTLAGSWLYRAEPGHRFQGFADDLYSVKAIADDDRALLYQETRRCSSP
jgi:hypothetical protein